MSIEKNMGLGASPQEALKNEIVKNKEEEGVENIDLTIDKIDGEFLDLQNETKKMNTDKEGYDIVKKLTSLYDRTLNLSNEIGYQPKTGKNQFATPTAMANERKIQPLRDKIHNFLMDGAWKKRDEFKNL